MELITIKLNELLEAVGEDTVKRILSDFSSPLNPDIENFLKRKALDFSLQRIAMTHIVFGKYDDEIELLGYYTLVNKSIFISDKAGLSKTIIKKIEKYSPGKTDICGYTIPIPLIAQFGKNYADGINDMITGDQLMSIVLDKIKSIENDIGGAFTYIECEDNEKLIDFYTKNGFVEFARRQLDSDETDLKGHQLIQMLKYIK